MSDLTCFSRDEQLAHSNDTCGTLTADKATSTATSHKTLDDALDKIASAAASFQRAGLSYFRYSEVLWYFCAGSWSRQTYERKVREAEKRLPERPSGSASVWADVYFAEVKLRNAVDVLRKGELWNDARDLSEAMEAVKRAERR